MFKVIIGLLTSIVGCVIKNCAIQSNLYWLLFTGQLISQFSWVFVSTFGGRLANLWCLKNEIALASALAIAGNALGMGLGYVIPSLIVTDFNVNATHCDNCLNDVSNQSSGDSSLLKNQLLILVSISTGISILNLAGMIAVYDRDPEQAANKAERRRSSFVTELLRNSLASQMTIHQEDAPVKPSFFPVKRRMSQENQIKIIKFKNYLKSIGNIITNKNCRYMMISQSLFTGTFYAILAILPIILRDNHQNNLHGMRFSNMFY